jgi:hypothetical protein
MVLGLNGFSLAAGALARLCFFLALLRLKAQ